uniref:Uncharacterized protein n=1 Tax=Avena sativa TaxID=4498 RepID=A0ACD5XCN1_AVESA
MGSSSSVVSWWEQEQLRTLVLGSLAVQYFLFFFAGRRKSRIPPCCRFFIWISYLASDALAIYALATLFNRQKKMQYHSRDLQVLWAPILLIHLGGQLVITAYNIEDNELWKRHIITSLSQVTVAMYVFCKSWPTSADKKLLAAAICLRAAKCFQKPLALMRASFSSLDRFLDQWAVGITDKTNNLEDYVRRAKTFMLQKGSESNDGMQYIYKFSSLFGLVALDGKWSATVAQHNLIGFFAQTKKHSKLVCFARSLSCEVFIRQIFAIESCYSSKHITKIVRQHIQDGWKTYITDTQSYKEFNDIRGSRKHLCNVAYDELLEICKGQETLLNERELAQKVVSTNISIEIYFVKEAVEVYTRLIDIDMNKMWKVIQGVWVEMLCFSAGRCRGYLHAKSIGSGGEFLSYIWLLLHNTGMETFQHKLERMQNVRLPMENKRNEKKDHLEGHKGKNPCSCNLSRTYNPEQREYFSRSSGLIGQIRRTLCSVFLDALLWWQERWRGRRFERGISDNKAVFPFSWRLSELVLLRGARRLPQMLLDELPWWKLISNGGYGEASFNKRFLVSSWCWTSKPLNPFLAGHGGLVEGFPVAASFGSRRAWGVSDTAFPWSIPSAAQVRLPNPVADRQHLQAPATASSQGVLYLQRRPYSGGAAKFLSSPAPCGLDGAGGGASCSRPELTGGVGGPDCFFCKVARVCFASWKDSASNVLFVGVRTAPFYY